MRLSNLLAITTWAASIVLAQDSSPGAPVHEGQPANCNGWHTVVEGDDCKSVPAKYSITFDQFLAWNPAVSRDCKTNFWLKQAYCVRIGASVTSTRTSTITTRTGISTSASATASATASVTKNGTATAITTSSRSFVVTSNTDPYSTRHPTITFNVTSTSINMAWPPEKTRAGQPASCNNWHLVQPGENCPKLAVRHSIGTNDLIKWNPDIGEDCSNLLAEWWICVGLAPQGDPAKFEWSTEPPDYTPPPDPTEHTRTSFPTADSSFVPSPSQGPMPSSCKAFHRVEDGQTCREVVAMYGLFTQQQFLSWNPVLNGNCDGLWNGNYYCVANFENKLPLPSHVTKAPNALPSGSPRDCVAWYETTGGDTCALISLMFGTFSESDFISWNPSVFSNCGGIRESVWYCVAKANTPTTRTGDNPPVTTAPTSRPTQSGVTNACTDWWLVGTSDTCERIRDENGITQAQLTAWNPAIDANCQGLEANKYICVGIGSNGVPSTTASITSVTRGPTSSRTMSSSAPTSAAGDAPAEVPQPSREGMAGNCRRFYMQQDGEFCQDIATKNGVSIDDFYTWNPAVGNECRNLWPGYYYCVGTSGQVTTIGKRSIAVPTS